MNSATDDFDSRIATLKQFTPKKELSEEDLSRYKERFETQLEELEGAAKLTQRNPGLTGAWYRPLLAIGVIHRDIGDLAKAEIAFKEANRLQPGAFVPYGNLADLYFRYERDCLKAEPYFLKVIEFEDSYLDTYYSELHELYRFCLNDEAKAEQILISAVKKYPNETSLLALLALYYKQTGQTEEAISRYKELLIKNPDSTVAKDALKELQPE